MDTYQLYLTYHHRHNISLVAHGASFHWYISCLIITIFLNYRFAQIGVLRQGRAVLFDAEPARQVSFDQVHAVQVYFAQIHPGPVHVRQVHFGVQQIHSGQVDDSGRTAGAAGHLSLGGGEEKTVGGRIPVDSSQQTAVRRKNLGEVWKASIAPCAGVTHAADDDPLTKCVCDLRFYEQNMYLQLGIPSYIPGIPQLAQLPYNNQILM